MEQVDIGYGIASAVGVSEDTERNIIEVYRAEWCREGSVVQSPFNTSSRDHVKLLGARQK